MTDLDVVLTVSVLSASVTLAGKMIWDWFQSGRVNDQYLKREEFLRHKKECCVLDLKRDFNAHKENDSRHDAEADSRLKAVEKRLDQGRADFKAIRADITAINRSLERISTILEMRWGHESKQAIPHNRTS